MKQAIYFFEGKREESNGYANFLLKEMQELTKKQADITTSLRWSDFIKELNELNTNYEKTIVSKITLDQVILKLKNEVKDNE